jgi:hypothetical protein
MLMIVAEPASAVPAEDDARQQAARICPEDHGLTVEVLGRPGFDCLLASHEQIFVDDLQMVEGLGLHSLHVVNPDVDRVVDERPDRSPQRIIPASSPISGCILPATLLCNNRSKVTPPPENFFQHVSHHLMSKNELFGNLFRIVISNCSARVSIVIDHPCEFCQHHLLSAGPYCPLPLYVKIEAEWKHFLKIF